MASPFDVQQSDFQGSFSGAAAQVVIPGPQPGSRNYLARIDVVTDANATLTITSNGATVFSMPLIANTPFSAFWPRGMRGTSGQDLTITISGGNGTINWDGVVA